MTERAAHLVGKVLPRVPVRQWVLTRPSLDGELGPGRPAGAPVDRQGVLGTGGDRHHEVHLPVGGPG